MNEQSLEILASIKASNVAFKNYEHQLERYRALSRGYADRVHDIQDQALLHHDWQRTADELEQVNWSMCVRIHSSTNDQLVELMDAASKELAARTATETLNLYNGDI